MVLVNAVYFKADWLHPFDKRDTREAPFHLLDGSVVTASMMRTDGLTSATPPATVTRSLNCPTPAAICP